MAMQSPDAAPANLQVRRPMVAPIDHLANPTRVDFYAPSDHQSTDAQATPSAISLDLYYCGRSRELYSDFEKLLKQPNQE